MTGEIKIRKSTGPVGTPIGRPRKYPLDKMNVNDEFETEPVLYQAIWSSIRSYRDSLCGNKKKSKSCPLFVITRITPDDENGKAKFKVTRTS
jgi:hypothetical protein